jgi:hypothetical protein
MRLRGRLSIEAEDGITMKAFRQRKLRQLSFGVGWGLTLLVGLGLRDAQGQAPGVSSPGTAQPGWYGYVPGSGWVSYAPASAPRVTPSAPSTPGTTLPVPPGWAGYSPATGWTGYAPASSPTYPAPAVRPPRRSAVPGDGSRRRLANQAVNRIAPELSYALPAYREYGSGRNVPLAKPWLPPSP